jgi:glyoxylase-like metal-dependent hydrolase (beta-lactamase superfamily II)
MVAPGLRVLQTGGHTVGSQIVEIDSTDGFYIYAGDIIATEFHLNPVIISAYDVSRADTYRAKQYIYETLRQKNGYLLLNHDNERWQIPIKDL